MTIDLDHLKTLIKPKFPLLFATVSGSHLYGFSSRDSDYDLRGVHILPLETFVGLEAGEDTIDTTDIRDGLEFDLVTHDVEKFFGLMLKRNGYVLEQLFSPLVVHTTPEHEELIEIGKQCITKHHAHHYLGFVKTQWTLFEKEEPPRIKPLLYVYRVLLTGIHLMRTGIVEANLLNLNQEFKLTYINDLIEQKTNGKEKGRSDGLDMDFHRSEYERLTAELEAAKEASNLPEENSARPALNDLLVRIRMSGVNKRRIYDLKDVAELIGYNIQDEVVYHEIVSIHDYYDGEHLWDNTKQILEIGLVRVHGKLYESDGTIFQEFETAFAEGTGDRKSVV